MSEEMQDNLVICGLRILLVAVDPPVMYFALQKKQLCYFLWSQTNASSCFWHTLGFLKRHCTGMKLVFVIAIADYQRVSHAKTLWKQLICFCS